MNPSYPTLTPPITNHIWFDVDGSYDEEMEVNLLDQEYQDFLCSGSQVASHIVPLGKTGTENPDAQDLSDDDGNDDSDDTESHDDDEDEEIAGNHTIETV